MRVTIKVLRWVAFVAVAAGVCVIFIWKDTLHPIAEIYLLIGLMHSFLQISSFTPKIQLGKIVSFISFNLLVAYMIVTSKDDGMTLAVAHLWYFFFCVGMEAKNRELGYYKTILVVLGIWIPLISFRLVSTAGNAVYFEHPYFSSTFMIAGVVLSIIGIIVAYLEQVNRDPQSVVQISTINWFSTLLNLVSHNIRTPLSNIMGNAQILEAKYPSLKEQRELFQIINSVKTADKIVNRLLKASFVTDNMSTLTLAESLNQAYPELVIDGELNELTYQQSVSIHLSLEVFLDNAFRFSPDRVELALNGNQIQIRDFGAGLNEEALNRFGNLNGDTLGTLHGIGIPFALRILDAIGYSVTAENSNPGLLVTVFPNSNSTPPPNWIR